MRVLITAAGAMRRWTDKATGALYGGVPKHLIPVAGEPLIARTVRMLRERGVDDIVIVGPDDPRYAIAGARLFVPTHHVPWAAVPATHDCDKFLSSRSEWLEDGRTVILHGDVYLAEDAADTIVAHDAPTWCLFARYRRFQRPFHKLETVAFSFHTADHTAIDATLARLVELQDQSTIRRTGTWELYRGMRGDPIRELRRISHLAGHQLTPGHSVEIDPPTTDLDKPAEYLGLLAHLGVAA